jgi:hypothetical protein
MSPDGYGQVAPAGIDEVNPRLAQAMAHLDAVRDAPPDEQVAPLADAQRALRETLDSIGDV